MQSALRITSNRLGGHSCLHARTALLLARVAFAPPLCSKKLAVSRTWQSFSTRGLSTSSSKQQIYADLSTSTANTPDTPRVIEDPFVYNGPLTTAFRRLKIFSLSSIGLSTFLTPFLFVIESNLPMNARFALATLALGTSALSTSLVAWAAKPYVTTMRRYRPDTTGSAEEVEMSTYTLFLRPLTTKVCNYPVRYRS